MIVSGYYNKTIHSFGSQVSNFLGLQYSAFTDPFFFNLPPFRLAKSIISHIWQLTFSRFPCGVER